MLGKSDLRTFSQRHNPCLNVLADRRVVTERDPTFPFGFPARQRSQLTCWYSVMAPLVPPFASLVCNGSCVGQGHPSARWSDGHGPGTVVRVITDSSVLSCADRFGFL